MQIARVFPRRTKASPVDSLTFFDGPPLWPVECDEVHVSVTFTYDQDRALALGRMWQAQGYKVKFGGPGYGERGEAFVPGRYLARGYVITSRGCPNRCWFCSVWRREGPDGVRELPVSEGWDVLDDNILACSQPHILKVFDMLKRQPNRARFTGGLEAARMRPWIAEALRSLRPETLYFAYDTSNDWEPMREAVEMLWKVGFSKAARKIRAYVLCGFDGDTQEKAEQRLNATLDLGIVPMCMMYRDANGRRVSWPGFQKRWSRPALIPASSRQ